jgi:hypothetical protein
MMIALEVTYYELFKYAIMLVCLDMSKATRTSQAIFRNRADALGWRAFAPSEPRTHVRGHLRGRVTAMAVCREMVVHGRTRDHGS